MAIINGFTTLTSVKSELKIPTANTNYDNELTNLINFYSDFIRNYLDREIIRTLHTEEIYAVNNNQYLYLIEYPIQGIPTVTSEGEQTNYGQDWFMEPKDSKVGRLYNPTGWVGQMWARGTFLDAFAGSRTIKVTYTAGWYLPADTLYSQGDPESLPQALQLAVNRAICTKFRMLGNEGLAALHEGGLSYTFLNAIDAVAGLDALTVQMLNQFKRISV